MSQYLRLKSQNTLLAAILVSLFMPLYSQTKPQTEIAANKADVTKTYDPIKNAEPIDMNLSNISLKEIQILTKNNDLIFIEAIITQGAIDQVKLQPPEYAKNILNYINEKVFTGKNEANAVMGYKVINNTNPAVGFYVYANGEFQVKGSIDNDGLYNKDSLKDSAQSFIESLKERNSIVRNRPQP